MVFDDIISRSKGKSRRVEDRMFPVINPPFGSPISTFIGSFKTLFSIPNTQHKPGEIVWIENEQAMYLYTNFWEKL